jgi:sugar porter (SP) family MFS transporter
MNSFQFLVAVTASLGGLLFGYEVGVMNVVLVMDAFRIYFRFFEWDGSALDEYSKEPAKTNRPPMYRNLKETNDKALLEGIITSSFVAGALCGALMATYLGERFGRQRTIMVGACIFTLGAILQGISRRYTVMISIGRLITGLSIGCNGVLCPTYISEVAPANIRGTLSSCYQLMTTFGIIVASLVNACIWFKTNKNPSDLNTTRKKDDAIDNLEWRLALLLQVIPGLGLATFMCFLPKSPRWLCSKDRDEEAVEVLAKLNAASTSDAIVQEELKAIQEDVAATRAAGSSSFGELFSSVIRRRTFITFLMQLFQQWTGINVIMYYQTQIYEQMGFTKVKSTVILPNVNNFVNFISTFPGMWGIERLGRKTLLIIGSIMMGVFHLSTFLCSRMTPKENPNTTWQYCAVASVFLFVFSFAWTWGPVPWVYQAEVFPLRVRVKGSAVGTVSNFLNNWIIGFVGPSLMKHWGNGTFLLFAAACALAWLYSQFYVIECKGLSLEEMDQKMAGKA